MKKIIISAIMMTSLFVNAKAAETESIIRCDVDKKTDVVTITGDFKESNAYAGYNLLVLNPGYTASDLPDDGFKAIQKQAEAALNEKGVLEIKFPINEANLDESGFCSVYVRLQNGSGLAAGVIEGAFFYSTSEDAENAIKDLNSSRSLSDSEVAEKIEKYKNVLSYSFAPYEAIDKTLLAKALKRSETPQFSETDFGEIQKWIKTQSIIEALNCNKEDAVFDGNTILYGEYIGITKMDSEENVNVYSLYGKLNSTGCKNVRDAITGKNLKNTDELKKAFAVQTVVEAVRNYSSGGYGHIKDVLETNAAYTGLDLTKYTSSAAADKKILNAKASDIDALQKAINNSSESKPQGGTGGTGGSGGGGKSSGGNVPAISEKIEQTVVSELDVYKTNSGIIDMENTKWASEAVDALIEKGVISNPEDKRFRPGDNITREEFVKLAVLAFGIEAEGEKEGFSDVAVGDWSYEYIYKAKNAGIINGLGDGRFGKKEYLSRQDMAVMLKRCCDYKGISLDADGEEIVFSDNESISDYASEAVSELAKAGVINGMEDATFRPSEKCTRAQCAKVIYLMIKE